MNTESQPPWTVLRLIEWTRSHFHGRQIESPRLAAEMLLAHVLGCQRIELYTQFDYQPTPEELAAYRDLVRRAGEHEPVAYLVGHKEFYSLPFRVTPDVLIPRPETEQLVSEVLGLLRPLTEARVWDVCTGSGCIAVATAVHAPHAQVMATDISPEAVAVAAENAEANGVGDRVRCRVADLLTVPDDCDDMNEVHVIASNPPYVAEGDPIAPAVAKEPKLALYGGDDGLAFVRPLIAAAADHLLPDGWLAMEFGFTHADAVADLLEATGRFDEPRFLKDYQDIERLVVVQRL